MKKIKRWEVESLMHPRKEIEDIFYNIRVEFSYWYSEGCIKVQL
jgi:hypothetical protein